MGSFVSRKRFRRFMVVVFLKAFPNFDYNDVVLPSGCTRCYGIKHDSDTDSKGELKGTHYHFVLDFKNGVVCSSVAKIFGVEVQNVKVVKNNWDSFEFAVQYLTHKNDSKKFQYDVNDVIKLKGAEDFDELYNKSRESIVDSCVVTCDTKNDFRVVVEDTILSLVEQKKVITSSTILDFVHDNNSPAFDYYVVNSSVCDSIIDSLINFYYRKNPCVNRSFTFVYGPSGSGKDTFIRQLVSEIYGLDDVYFTSNKKNPFDSYASQSCVVISDFDCRNPCIPWKDFLALSDNYNFTNEASSRYKDKNLSHLSHVIISTTDSPRIFAETFQTEVEKDSKDISSVCFQFYRRISAIYEIIPRHLYNSDCFDWEGFKEIERSVMPSEYSFYCCYTSDYNSSAFGRWSLNRISYGGIVELPSFVKESFGERRF